MTANNEGVQAHTTSEQLPFDFLKMSTAGIVTTVCNDVNGITTHGSPE